MRLLVKPRNGFDTATTWRPVATSGGNAFRQGFLTNLLNPKVGVFYITFLPQFIPVGANVAAFSFMLACVHVILNVFWFGAIIAAAVPLGERLRRGRVVRVLDRLTGGVFIAFGVRLALDTHP